MSDQESNQLYLQDVHLVDYKSIEDLSIDFKQGLNILIGKNGAGKSNLLGAIQGALYSRTNGVRFPFKSFEANFSTSDKRKFRFLITKIKRSSIKNGEDDLFDQEFLQQLYAGDDLIMDTMEDETGIRLKLAPNIRTAFRRQRIFYYSPLYIRYAIPEVIECITEADQIKIPLEDPEMIRVPISIDAIDFAFNTFENFVLDDKVNILEINKEYLLKHIVVDENLIRNLSKSTPIKGFKLNENINIYNDGKDLIIDNLKFDFLINGKWMPWSYLSDGTKRLFYLIAEVTTAQGRLILIEEPELGVHPHQFDLVMNFLKEQSRYSQIIISTHAPTALNHLEQDELDRVLIAYTTPDKGTQVKRMEASQKEKAIQYMTEVGSLSDYWLMSDLEE